MFSNLLYIYSLILWKESRFISNEFLSWELKKSSGVGDVITDVKATTKEGIIKETVQKIEGLLSLDANVLTDLLLDRERLMPTALNNEIAVPHTREFLIKKPFKDALHFIYKQHLLKAKN